MQPSIGIVYSYTKCNSDITRGINMKGFLIRHLSFGCPCFSLLALTFRPIVSFA
jgi:hypothetical protein